MTAYWINTYLEVRDEAKLAAYADLAGPALKEAGGTFLARSTASAAFESGRVQRTVLIEFANLDAALAAHESEGYQAALVALGDGAVRDLRIVEGIEPTTAHDRP